jgi:hypothetical protein
MIGAMTERGLPIVDGAPACPFVAFEDDRDERAASPDHRHRCYAEAHPAPRALAHQEAYCLSSAFPVCPTFQDWARREAARSRADRPARSESLAAGIASDSPQRNPPRNWAAPPPWASRGGRGEGDADWDEGDSDDPDAAAEGEWGRDALPRRGRGLSGSYADRVAGDPGAPPPGGFEDDDAEAPVAPVAPSPHARDSLPEQPTLAGSMAPGHDAWEDDGAGSAADSASHGRRRERDPGRVAAFAGGEPHGAPPSAGSERRPERRRDARAPEWESARPMEAYPTLRARRLPELSVPPLLVAVLALALAAAVLFALPGLLGFGSPSAVATPTPTPRPTIGASLPPTPVPAPTQQVYIVQSGDTMSRIANRFGIPLGDLIAANQETIPDPDQLQIGDTVIIPVPIPSELPAASVG